MLNTRPLAAVLVMMALAGAPVASFAADDVAALRAEIEALKKDYADKVAALEARVSQLESRGPGTPATAGTPQTPAPAEQGAQPAPTPATESPAQLEAEAAAAGFGGSSSPPAPAPDYSAAASGGGARGGQTAFNPAISVILAGTYGHLSEDPSTYRIAGFIPSGDEVGPGERSFNLG